MASSSARWWSSLINPAALASDYAAAPYALGELVRVEMQGRAEREAGSAGRGGGEAASAGGAGSACRPLSPASLSTCAVAFHGRVVCIDRTATILRLSCEAETFEEGRSDPYPIIGLRVHLRQCRGRGEAELSSSLLSPSDHFCYLVTETTATGARTVQADARKKKGAGRRRQKRRRSGQAAAMQTEAIGRWVVERAMTRVEGRSSPAPSRGQRAEQRLSADLHRQWQQSANDSAIEEWAESESKEEEGEKDPERDSDWRAEDETEEEEEEKGWSEDSEQRARKRSRQSRPSRALRGRGSGRVVRSAEGEGGAGADDGLSGADDVDAGLGLPVAPQLPLLFSSIPPPVVLYPNGARPAHRKHRALRRCWLCTQPPFPSEVALFTHLRDIHSAHCCMYCRERLPDAESLQLHQGVHGQGLPLCCRYCGKGFQLQPNRDAHERVHTGAKPYLCRTPHCNRRFSEHNNRKRHELRCQAAAADGAALQQGSSDSRSVADEAEQQHPQPRRFPCSVCGASFTRSEVRREHERIHTGERPFQCRHCGDSFTQRAHRSVHQHKCRTRRTARGGHGHSAVTQRSSDSDQEG